MSETILTLDDLPSLDKKIQKGLIKAKRSEDCNKDLAIVISDECVTCGDEKTKKKV